MSTQPLAIAPDPSSATLRLSAVEVFEQMQKAMKRLVGALPEPVARAVDLQNALGIYSVLAWRAFKIATVDEPMDVVDYMLTPALTKTLVEAAEAKGVSPTVTAELLAAVGRYNELKKEHAGDHESFMMMLASLRPKKKSLLDEKFRKNLFQHNRLAWGNQCDITMICFIVMPGNDQSSGSTATVLGTLGYHQLRPGSKELTISNQVAHKEVDHSHELTLSRGFLTEYCTPGLNMQILQQGQDVAKARIMLPEIGRQSAIDYFQLFTSNSVFEEDQYVSINLNVASITTMLHMDIMLPATGEPRKTLAQVFGRNNGEMYNDNDVLPEDLIPVEQSPEYLGSSADVAPAEGAPRYSNMIRSVLKRLGWYGRAFDIYRNRLAYPILRTRVSLTVEPPASIS